MQICDLVLKYGVIKSYINWKPHRNVKPELKCVYCDPTTKFIASLNGPFGLPASTRRRVEAPMGRRLQGRRTRDMQNAPRSHTPCMFYMFPGQQTAELRWPRKHGFQTSPPLLLQMCGKTSTVRIAKRYPYKETVGSFYFRRTTATIKSTSCDLCSSLHQRLFSEQRTIWCRFSRPAGSSTWICPDG